MHAVRVFKLVLLCQTLAWVAAAPAHAQQPSDELVDLVIELISDDDQDIRALAFEQIRTEAPGVEATRRFAEELPKLSPAAQSGLLAALAARGDSAAKPALLELLESSESDEIRVAAITALGKLGDASDVPRLVKLATAEADNERLAARRSLVELRGSNAAQSLLVELRQSPSPTRVALIEILAQRRALEAIPELLQCALDARGEVRRAAMTALGKLASPEHVPGMVRGILRAEKGSERAAAEKSTVVACRRIRDLEQQATPVLTIMEKLDPPDRITLLSVLGRIGGRQALERIDAAIANTEAAVHSAGVKAISNWPDATVADRLIRLSLEDEHPKHRTTALRALIRIAPLPDGRSDDEKLKLLQQAMSMCSGKSEQLLALQRASAIRIPETLRFVTPYLEEPDLAERACLTIVELAHHRGLREASKAEFHAALDRVIQQSSDAVVVDRARRYKNNQTWVRPKATRPKSKRADP